MANIKVGEALKNSGQEIVGMQTVFSDILNESYDLVGKITADWQGQAQVAFLNDFNRTKAQLEELPETIANFGNAAIQAAEQYILPEIAAWMPQAAQSDLKGASPNGHSRDWLCYPEPRHVRLKQELQLRCKD